MPALRDWLTGALALVILLGGSLLLYRLFTIITRRLLWRVRRKLTLSYIFIGFVPALLIVAFFLLCGLLIFFNVSSYLVQSRVRTLVDQVQFLAQAAALELRRAPGDAGLPETLDREREGAAQRYPTASFVAAPATRTCGDTAGGAGEPLEESIVVGPWTHAPAPSFVPDWVQCAGYAGLITQGDRAAPVAARAVAWPAAASGYAVVVDIPLDAEVTRQLRQDTGIEMGPDFPVAVVPAGNVLDRPLEWVVFLDYADWETGLPDTATVAIRTTIAGIYGRISATQVQRIGNLNFGQVLLILLAVVAGLFVVIQIVAFGMGLALARSITGSVHELFAGTERLRRGDFTHKIAIHTRDQLGELAESFNSMTASIEHLLEQKAEKDRLEQELRIARTIQMSLLPQGPLRMAGLSLAGHCEPAREVGGDYYDFLPIDEHRVGILVADVAGKGASAALYMAELKGLMLALSQTHRSPRALLIEANRIISQHLDTRSFITITYAVVDLEARTLTYARAGHCPLMYLPGPGGSSPPRVQILAPDGLVLGLTIDNGERFNSLLKEMVIPLTAGDLFVLYTDGITEAMDPGGDWFGDERLGAIIEGHAGLPFDDLRERILGELAVFVDGAPQQDDMTMLLLKVE